MKRIYLLLLILVMSVLDSQANLGAKESCANVKAPLVLLRKKRHLTFPPGTTAVLTLSLVKAIMVHAPSGWNIAIEIDVIYPMLSPEMTNALFRKKLHHKQKREIWETIENALDSYNMHGRSCIYRSICEARVHLAAPGRSLVHDILRSIFTAPVHDEEFKNEINETYGEVLESNFCTKAHECPISLIETILAFNNNR